MRLYVLLATTFLFIFFFSTSVQAKPSHSALTRTARLDSAKWTLYFTLGAEKDLIAYQKIHQLFDHQFEIPALALVNKRDEITRVIPPPPSLIFPLLIDKKELLQINTSNQKLIAYWENSKYPLEEKEAYTLRFIQNTLQNPMGKLELKLIHENLYIEARLYQDTILFPLSFIKQMPQNLFTQQTLDLFFNHQNWSLWDHSTFLLNLTKKLQAHPSLSLSLKKTWFAFVTETSSQYSEAFLKWSSFYKAREPELAYSFTIHSHPYPQQWMATIPFAENLPEWTKTIDFVLLPSSLDLYGDLQKITPFAGIYTFKTGKADWAYYPVSESFYLKSIQINQLLAVASERKLSPKEVQKGQLLVKELIAFKASFHSLVSAKKIKKWLKGCDPARATQDQQQMEQLTRKFAKYHPEWAKEVRKKIFHASHQKQLIQAKNTWELFMAQHFLSEEITAAMFYVANQMQLKIIDMKGDAEEPFTIDETLLGALEKILEEKHSSQAELLNQFLQILFVYLNI